MTRALGLPQASSALPGGGTSMIAWQYGQIVFEPTQTWASSNSLRQEMQRMGFPVEQL
jgi:hypothetical protein